MSLTAMVAMTSLSDSMTVSSPYDTNITRSNVEEPFDSRNGARTARRRIRLRGPRITASAVAPPLLRAGTHDALPHRRRQRHRRIVRRRARPAHVFAARRELASLE